MYPVVMMMSITNPAVL